MKIKTYASNKIHRINISVTNIQHTWKSGAVSLKQCITDKLICRSELNVFYYTNFLTSQNLKLSKLEDYHLAAVTFTYQQVDLTHVLTYLLLCLLSEVHFNKKTKSLVTKEMSKLASVAM